MLNNYKKYKNPSEYLLVFALWLVIFGKNAFSQMLFVDYVPSTFIDTAKNIQMSDYIYRFNLFDLFRSILIPVNLGHIAFQLSILLAMLFSYYYIKKTAKNYSLLFALIFFFNPFIYSRIMVGQLGVVLSYLLLPVFIFYLFKLFESKFSYKTAAKTVLSATVISMFQLQFFVFIFILFAIALLISVFSKQKKFTKKEYAKITFIFIAVMILLNLYWIQGFFSETIFSSINAEHESFFAPKQTQGISAIAKVFGLWGFWRENGYITPYQQIPQFLWYFMLAILLALMLWGYYNDADKFRSKFFFSIWWLSIIMAVGISHPYVQPFFDFLFKNMPFFNGFRDSHKFLALTALSFAYFIPQAVKDLNEKLKKRMQSKNIKILQFLLIILLLLFILLYTYPLIDISKQIHSVGYPDSYFKADAFLENKNIDGYIIYLPWQTYLTYNWTIGASSDGRIAVPINQIISRQVILGPDKWGSSSVLTDKITTCLSQQNIECLENAGVEYIIKDSCAFYLDSYLWINISEVYSYQCLSVYQLNNSLIKEQPIPMRFFIGLQISIITFLLIIFVLYLPRLLDKNKEQQKTNTHTSTSKTQSE